MVKLKLTPTFYDVLGVEKDCATDEIRKAYRKRVLETHPDKLDPSATEEEKQAAQRQFHKVHDAFQALGDPGKRRRYDALLAFRSDPALVSEDSARRTAERREWARQQEEMTQRRINSFRHPQKRRPASQKAETSKEETKKDMPKPKAEPQPAKKVVDVLQALMSANPEFAARREAILKRKAERERFEKEKLAQQQSPPGTAVEA